MVNRVGLVVHYQGKKVLDKLNEFDVNVYYTSKKQHYSVFYIDSNREKEIKKVLQNVKGFRKITETLLYDESYNFEENPKKKDIYADENTE